jgi:hypothetical protein
MDRASFSDSARFGHDFSPSPVVTSSFSPSSSFSFLLALPSLTSPSYFNLGKALAAASEADKL